MSWRPALLQPPLFQALSPSKTICGQQAPFSYQQTQTVFPNVCASDQVAAANRVVKLERKVLVLAQNISFLAHNHVANTEQTINTSDVFVVTRGWTGNGVATTGGAIAVLVRYPEGAMGVVKATFEAGVSVVDALCTKVDEMLAENF